MERPDPTLAAKLAKVRLVLMDIDGTLVTSSKATFDNVSNQLRRLKPLNIHFSVATGRTIAGSSSVLEQLRKSVGMRMPPAINYNGAVLTSTHDGYLVERHILSPDLVASSIVACRKMGLWPLVYACDDTVSGPPVETVYLDQSAPPSSEFNGMQTKRVPDLSALPGDVVAILADAGSAEGSRSIIAELSVLTGKGLRVSTSGSRYVEICAHEATKVAAMARLAKLHHVGIENVMAIGDNLNDLEMIEAAGVGIAVGNAPDEVRAVADYACSHESAMGVVEALRMLVRVLHLESNRKSGAGICCKNEHQFRKTSKASWPVTL